MAVSKRLRYEILRRDNHACRYCGATAPDVRLVVDHVVPETLGGKTEPSNLVTACDPCNSGKTSIAPDSPLVAQVEQDALRWSRAIAAAADRMLAEHEAREADVVAFERRWNENVGRGATLPTGWRESVRRFIASGLPLPILLASLDKAAGNTKLGRADVFRYTCGIAWKLVGELNESASAAVGGRPQPESTAEDELALELLQEGHDTIPDLYRDALAAAAADLDEDPADRLYDGASYEVIAARHLVGCLVGQLTVYEGVVTRALRGLTPTELAAVEEAVEADYYKAGVAAAHETEALVHKLRHMLRLSRPVES